MKTILRRVALDSMPAARLAVLRAVTAHEGASTSMVARYGGMHRHVAHRHCEDLAAIGVLNNLSASDDRDDQRDQWAFNGDEGEVVRTVITEWNEWVDHE